MRRDITHHIQHRFAEAPAERHTWLCLKSREESANGAIYKSPGQARSASPWVYHEHPRSRPERPKYAGNYALSGLERLIVCYQGRRACPWLSYFAPLALRSDF